MSTVWFVIGFLLLYISLIVVKKSERKQNIIIWCMVSFLATLCFHTFVAGILNLISISINLWTMGASDILCGVLLLREIKLRGVQEHFCRKIDLIAVFAVLVLAVSGAIKQFGLDLNMNYASADAATHFRLALEVMKSQKVEGLFFSSLNNGLFLSLFVPFVKATSLYHLFVFLDIVMYFVSGCIFYCAIADGIDGRFKGGLAVVLTCLYMYGYPRNNMLYGFNYLGMSISLILFLTLVVKFYLKREVKRGFVIPGIMVGCLALGVCYSLFVPVVYVSVCLAVSLGVWLKETDGYKKKIVNLVIENLKIFVIPCVLVLIYSLIGYFGPAGSDTTISTGISSEGGIYRDLFSNFIFWIPFTIYGWYMMVKKKKNDLMIYYAVFLVMFMLILGIAGMYGYVSSYYFYKNYFFLSAVIFYLSFMGICFLLELDARYVLINIGVLFALGVATIFGIEGKIQSRNFLFSPSIKSQYYFDIYVTNNSLLENQENYSKEKMELYEYCYDNYSMKNNSKIVVCSSIYDLNIFRAITQRIGENDYIFWKYLSEEEIASTGIEEEIDIRAYAELLRKTEGSEKEIPFLIIDDTGEVINNLEKVQGLGVKTEYQNSEGVVGILEFNG